MLKFQRSYFIFSILLFLTEVFIAVFVHDGFIRPYVGDYLVVILIYCFIKSFFNSSVLSTAIFVLLFSYTIETLQYFNIVDKLGLKNCKIAAVIIGTSFQWLDILAYTLGIATVLIIEAKMNGKRLLAKKIETENKER